MDVSTHLAQLDEKTYLNMASMAALSRVTAAK
jgi:hypothetical protein